MKNEEIVKVASTKVKCGGGIVSHPMVFLEMGDKDTISCPYCGAKFVLIAEKDGALPDKSPDS